MHPSFQYLPLLLLTAPVLAVPTASEPPPAPVVAPEPDTEPVFSVDELVRLALKNNPQLPIARQTEEAARQRLGALRSFPSPLLQLVPGVGNREARDEEVILSQPLDLFGQRRAQAGVAAAELRRTQAETHLVERTLVVQVKNAAADLFAAQEAEHLGEVQVEVAQLFRDAAARRAELGDAPPVQAQRAELELLRVQNDLTTAQAERLARRAALNQLTGQPPEAPLRVTLPLSAGQTGMLRVRPGPLRAGAASDEEPSTGGAPVIGSPVIGSSAQAGSDLLALRGQVLPGALTNRPDVVSAQATLEARQAQINVLRRQRLPSVELQARRSAFFTSEGSYALRAVVVLPFLDFGSLKRERRAVEAEVRAQEATIGLLRSQVAAQIEQALIRLRQQQATVERYRTGIVPISVDLLRKTQIGYAAGASTYLEVLEAQRTLRQVQTEYWQALVGVRTQEASLESALGTTLPVGLTGTLLNPSRPETPPGVAAPGTVPPDTIPPNIVPPVSPSSANGPATQGGESLP